MNKYITACRPGQWIKNLIIFAALVFSKNFFNAPFIFKTTLAFISFSLMSSSIYIVNDLFDIKKDKHHPQKKRRPIASGKIRIRQAMVLFLTLFFISFITAYNIEKKFAVLILIYFLIMVLYSFGLKNIVILDIMIIAVGFVIRAWSGAMVINVDFSNWLLFCTFLFSLLLGFGKRRSELAMLKKNAPSARKVHEKYNEYILNSFINVTSACVIVFYVLYTMSESTIRQFGENLRFTIPFVVFAVFRYIYLVERENIAQEPEKLLIKDKHILISFTLWILTVLMVIYK